MMITTYKIFPNIFEQLKIFDVCYTNYKAKLNDLEESSKQNKYVVSSFA